MLEYHFVSIKGASVNVKDKDDNAPLHLAALNGHTSMISFLVESGANIFM
jgi:ankyrin repeat protein